MKGLLINFEGLDYSFKETNTERLLKYVKENITDKVELHSFPNYENDSSIFVKKYLEGFYGKSSEVNPYEASICYAIDRYHSIKEKQIKEKLEEGYIIILDRYVGSNLIFQTTKLKDLGINEIENYINYTIDFEYNKLNLPKEDITIFMNMPVDISYKLMMERELKAGTSVDGHEGNYKFMKDVEYTATNYIVPKLGYNVVNCTENGEIRSEEDIFSNILNILKKDLTIK